MLADELGDAGLILPLSEEKLAQKGVKGLFFVAILLASTGILLLQRSQEPLENQERPLGRVCFFGRSREDWRVLTPVRAKLSQASTRKNEGGCREACEIAVEGSDGLFRPEESATHRLTRSVFATGNTDLEEGTPTAASSCGCVTVLLHRIHDVW